jgi:hypothetical protein
MSGLCLPLPNPVGRVLDAPKKELKMCPFRILPNADLQEGTGVDQLAKLPPIPACPLLC